MTDKAAYDAIRTAVGPKGWTDDPGELEPYLTERRGTYRGRCVMAVRPATTAEAAEVVRICADAGVPIFPQGGNTGLVGGGVPDGGIVLSTVRLNRIRAVDVLNHTMIVEAGVILADIQKAADDVDCLFPLSLASEGSCRIGGNLSTNAGGNAVLRYGNARDLVLGLEVILPDGNVWDGLRGLRKDNTGYDLKHLFIGAEGTLGVITAAVLKLFPKPRQRETAIAALGSIGSVLELFKRARATLGENLTGFEAMARICVTFVLRHAPGVKDPFSSAHRFYALLELTSPRADEHLREALETVLGQAIEDGVVEDAVVAASAGQAREIWKLRESASEAQTFEGVSIKHDVAVPVSRIAEFIERATRIVENEVPGIRVVAFGHIGDGNVHFNLSQPAGTDGKAFLPLRPRLNTLVHDLAIGMAGSFSAEHGVGILRREELVRYKPAVEVALMRTVKQALDPKNIMNPGKILS